MVEHSCDYLIIGAGLAGAAAIEGIRERDRNGTIAMIGEENHLPYNRPPLSKKLWFGKTEVKKIFVHDQGFYDQSGVSFFPGTRVVSLDAKSSTATNDRGQGYRFKKLLLATGGLSQKLRIPGGEMDGVCYFRTLDDYQQIRSQAEEGRSVVIIGGGFIGSEMAAALRINKLNVTMIYPATHLCDRVLPADLGLAMEQIYQDRGIRILKGQKPNSIERKGSAFLIRTSGGEQIESDILIVGIGIKPAVELAEGAGLSTSDGVIVDEFLQTSYPNIYAAGDTARFPYQALGQQARVEHWDNALNQGKHAGRNMAGAHEVFTYMPYFFSDLFEFGYEAVGEVDSRMEIVADWRKKHHTGVLYYLRNNKIRGAMMCNVWDRVEAARQLILRGANATERLA
jgi:3-phenylpropionate/trans-cinnamate dioxygenase ferredoxin reductase component